MSQIVYPQSKEEAGAHYWNTMFNIASLYPQHPSRDDKINTHNLIKSIVSKFTCQECIDNAFAFMRKHPAELDSRENLLKWLCRLKNNSNVHAGKPEIDCDSFLLNSFDASSTECKSCMIEPIKAPSVNINPVKPVQSLSTTIEKDTTSDSFESVWNWRERYPSIKKSINIQEEKTVSVGNDLETQYPSLAGFESELNTAPKEEEMDGLLKPLDSLYAGPANLMGIKPYEFNLAYTPEMLTNGLSLITQMYFTNFGSLLTTLLSSISLVGISVFAKNSLSHYDRLFLQNTTGSMFFHALNFINPRIRDEVLPSATRFFEGITTMNFEKVKEAILYGHDSVGKGPDELMDMIRAQDGIVDMGKLERGYSARDLQNASQIGRMGMAAPPPDLRTVGGSGFGGSGGAITKDEINRMFDERRQQSNYKKGASPNYDVLGAAEDRFSYILDNNLI